MKNKHMTTTSSTNEEFDKCVKEAKEFILQSVSDAISIIIKDSFNCYKPNKEFIFDEIANEKCSVFSNKETDKKTLASIIMSDIDDDLIDLEESYKALNNIFDRAMVDVILYMRHHDVNELK